MIDLNRRYGLQARLVLGTRWISVDLVQVSFGGGTVRLLDKTGVALSTGQGITLRLRARGLPRALEIAAQVVGRRPDEGAILYSLHFRDPEALRMRVPPRIIGAFNRRRAFRVTPDSGAGAIANIERDGVANFSLPVLDVSSSGIALLARTLDQQLLMAGDRIQLVFALPEAGDLALRGTVRYGKQQRSGVRYGIEFDPRATDRFSRLEAALNRYIMAEQRKMLSHKP